jgi:hypothetical protein
VRRLLITCACLTAAVYAMRLIAARRRPPVRWQPAVTVDQPPAAEVVPLPVRAPEPEPKTAPKPVRDSERRLLELADLRRELASSVDRRALYAMAHDRGLPHHALFSMGADALLESILECEEIPPADVLPSQATAERMAAIAEEAFARHARLLADDAAALDAG